MPMNNANQNIAFIITSTGWGGLEMNTLKLARVLIEKGYQLTLFTQKEAKIATISEKIVSNLVTFNVNRKYFDFSNAKKIASHLKKQSISKIIVFDTKDLDLISWVKRLYYKNLTVIYQQHMQLGINKKNLFQTYRFKSIDIWVSPLNYLKEEVGVRTKFPRERIQVIPIGLDNESLLNKNYSKDEALQQLGVTPKHPLLGLIGRISEKKGQLRLIQMAHELIKEGLLVEVLIYGSPTINDAACLNYLKKIKTYITNNQLDNYIHILPHNEDVNLFYQAIDIFVLASESETYGMVTLEAMLFELPIVATSSGGTSEILGQGEFGLLYEVDDLKKGVELIKLALTNPNKMKEKAENAKKIVLEKYTLSEEITRLEKILKR